MVDELFLHNDCIQAFNNKLYSDILSTENVKSKQKVIVHDGDKYYGYFMEKGKKQYFLPAAFMDKVPLKISQFKEIDYKGDVYDFIIKVDSIIIPSAPKLTFRDLVDIMPAFNHSNPIHFLLYKMVAIAGYCDRINARVSTDAGFGKDSVVNIIHELVDSTLNLYGATFAKLEYGLTNKLIILNEMGNLKKDEKIEMQEFLLATGAYFNTYNKRTRKTNSTQETYNISDLSLLIFYNLPEYYTGKGQEYFDQMFTKAVVKRFIPLVFKGVITTKFEKLLDSKAIMDEHEPIYKDIIATLNYYRNNRLKTIKYDIPPSVEFPKKEQLERYDRTFNVIMKYISEYAKNQGEFNELVLELFSCYEAYKGELVKEREIF